MVSVLQKLILLAQLLPLGWANPIEVTSRQLDISGEIDLDVVDTIPLRRSKHDLQQSSNALRKRAANLNFAQHNTAATSYQSGYAILRSTGASFLAPVTFGSQSFLAIVDTGSADTVSPLLSPPLHRSLPQSHTLLPHMLTPQSTVDCKPRRTMPRYQHRPAYSPPKLLLRSPVRHLEVQLQTNSQRELQHHLWRRRVPYRSGRHT